MEVHLNVIDRLHLAGMLVSHGPGNLVTMRMVAGLKDRFGISPIEISELGIKQEAAGVSVKQNEIKTFSLSTAEEVFLKDMLQKKLASGGITVEEVSLYDAFGITD